MLYAQCQPAVLQASMNCGSSVTTSSIIGFWRVSIPLCQYSSDFIHSRFATWLLNPEASPATINDDSTRKSSLAVYSSSSGLLRPEDEAASLSSHASDGPYCSRSSFRFSARGVCSFAKGIERIRATSLCEPL
jgi:hypothetical protein